MAAAAAGNRGRSATSPKREGSRKPQSGFSEFAAGSTEYARAAVLGAPEAVPAANASRFGEVADRWHLLANVRDMLERWLARAHARLRDLPVPPGGDGRCLRQRTQAFRHGRTEIAASADNRARWFVACEDVRRRHLAGEALLAIGRATGLARATVRKHAYAENFPERAVRRPGRSVLDPFVAYLGNADGRGLRGRDGAVALWRELRARGYAHGPKMVQKWVAENRTGPRCELPSPCPGAAARPRDRSTGSSCLCGRP